MYIECLCFKTYELNYHFFKETSIQEMAPWKLQAHPLLLLKASNSSTALTTLNRREIPSCFCFSVIYRRSQTGTDYMLCYANRSVLYLP